MGYQRSNCECGERSEEDSIWCKRCMEIVSKRNLKHMISLNIKDTLEEARLIAKHYRTNEGSRKGGRMGGRIRQLKG